MKLNVRNLMLSSTFAAACFLGNTASAYTCALGYTCFNDDATGAWGRVEYNNDYWTAFGWNNRADFFHNNGRSYNNCIYDGFDQKGSKFMLYRGQVLFTTGGVSGSGVASDPYWRNRVSSNKWTSASQTSQCPTQ